MFNAEFDLIATPVSFPELGRNYMHTVPGSNFILRFMKGIKYLFSSKKIPHFITAKALVLTYVTKSWGEKKMQSEVTSGISKNE